MLEHETLGRLAAVRLGRPGAGSGDAVVDLLFASSAIETIAAEATLLEMFPQVSVPVARTGHLIALKLLARDDHRPQDDVDLRQLLGVANDEELGRAEAALSLVVQRGAHRGRDLARDLEQLLAEHR